MAARQATLVGLFIVLVSVFGAFVTWRAAAASGTASDLDQRARQARIEEAQIRAGNAAVVAFEHRLFDRYRDHHELADAYRADGDRLRAREERAAARSLGLLFYAAAPWDDKGRPAYQHEQARLFVEGDQRLIDLRPTELERAAKAGREKRFWLVAVDTLLIASIFFSTLALLVAAGTRWVAVAGLLLGTGAAVAYVVVELSVSVPAA